MLNDESRNRAFTTALKSILESRRGQLSVLDLGSGSGLLGIAADTIGAKQVTCVEFNDPIAQVSQLIIDANEVNVDLHSCLSTDLNAIMKYNVLITEIFDCALLGEDAIRSILDAKKRLLTSNGETIPKRARIYCQAMYSEQMMNKSYKHFSDTCTVGSFYTTRRKPNRGNGDEPYEGDRVADLRDIDLSTLTQKSLLMECDFTSIAQMERIVNFPETKTIKLQSDCVVNMLVITFELELTDSIIINNNIGTAGCWEQAIYPLRRELSGEIEATFKLECDSPVLLSVQHECDMKIQEPTIFVSERLVYLFNEAEREFQVTALFKLNDCVIFYTLLPDYDIIYESIRTQKKLFLIGCNLHQEGIAKFISSISTPSKVTISSSIDEALMLSPESYKIPFYINFLDKNGMLNWPLLEDYIHQRLFDGINANDTALMMGTVSVTVNYRMVESKWLRDRVLLSNRNIPMGLDLANTVNLFQMTTYPLFQEVDISKIVTLLSPQFSQTIKLEPNCANYHYQYRSNTFHIPSSAKGERYISRRDVITIYNFSDWNLV